MNQLEQSSNLAIHPQRGCILGHTPESRARAYEKIKQRRKKWFLENGPCQKCGSLERLELDHRDPKTKVSHKIWSWSEARRVEELAKCQVLCRSCHEKKTGQENSDRQGGPKHGTEHMYRNLRCRCDKCLEFRRGVKRRDYARKMAKLRS